MRVRLDDPLKRKQLKKGLDQLSEEGAVQLFFDRQRMERDPILGAVGVLQFEVIEHRLMSEYRVPIGLDRLPYRFARWIEGTGIDFDKLELPGRQSCVIDVEGRPLVLFETECLLRRTEEKTGASPSSPPSSPAAATDPRRDERPRRSLPTFSPNP